MMIPKNCHYPKVCGNKPIESGTLVQCLPLFAKNRGSPRSCAGRGADIIRKDYFLK